MRAGLALVVLVACTAEPTTSEEVVALAKKKQTVTRIRVNGQTVDAHLTDLNTGTEGAINVSRDEINNTTAMDFSYATPSPSDPDFAMLVQGAGEIPNSAYTQSDTTAHLLLSTPFPVTVCTVNIITGDFTCTTGAPIAFDLTWQANGFQVVEERTKRTEILGPLTTKFNGDFVERSALINGTWNGNTANNMSGHLTDTGGSTVIREITMQMN